MDLEFLQDVRTYASRYVKLSYSAEKLLYEAPGSNVQVQKSTTASFITNAAAFTAVNATEARSDVQIPPIVDASASSCIPNANNTSSTNSKSNTSIANYTNTAAHFDRGVELSLRAPEVYFQAEKGAGGAGAAEGDAENATAPLCCADPWDDDRLQEAEQRIRDQGSNVSDFWRDSYRERAAQHWHAFYKRNTDNFYKDRHYLHVEFPELLQYSDSDSVAEDGARRLQLLEVGCGVGNAVTPLLDLNASLYANAIDFARSAIEILRQHPSILKHPGRLIANTCNVITEPLPLSAVVRGQLDVVLCMFVLSAIAPEQQLGVLQKLAADMKCGARLCFRDYGRYDEAQLRFKKGSKIQENLYVRNDGTMAYYFELNELIEVCRQAGLVAVEGRCGYVRVQQMNRSQGKARHRVFVQAVFEKIAYA